MKTVAEPSGACALAALLAGRVDAKGLRVGVTISGGNVDAGAVRDAAARSRLGRMAWNVVILGGGFGGLYTARKLEKLLPPASARVTLINDVNFMLYTPLLPGAAGGTLEPRHVVVPLREQLKSTHLKLARVTRRRPVAQAGDDPLARGRAARR